MLTAREGSCNVKHWRERKAEGRFCNVGRTRGAHWLPKDHPDELSQESIMTQSKRNDDRVRLLSELKISEYLR